MGEATLWTLSNVICMGVALGALFLVGSTLLGWGPARMGMYMSIAAVLTSTWGSWASLIWTRNRGLRSLQQAVTTIPGISIFAFGVVLMYLGLGKWMIGLAFAISGLGLIAVSVLLAGGFFSKNEAPSRLQVLLGLTAYPLATTIAAGGIASLWYTFVMTPTGGGLGSLRSLFTLATLFTSIIASALISTVLPSLLSRGTREVSAQITSRYR